uniref:Uncharacterized protein n=1 Tax=Anguilla anguilla TaxID=7936 RepID=A0A0E9RFW8_ANGAN
MLKEIMERLKPPSNLLCKSSGLQLLSVFAVIRQTVVKFCKQVMPCW